MKINVHGGHNRHVTGIVSYLDEVTEDRKLKDAVIKYLRAGGNTVYDCTDDDGKTQRANLSNIVKKCNAHEVDLDVSIHINGSTKSKKDGKVKGSEVLVYSGGEGSRVHRTAKSICEKLNGLGFTNRGVKIRKDLYFLKHTTNPALLIEVCFADDEDDVILYKKTGIERIALSIAEAITGKEILPKDEVNEHTAEFKVWAKKKINIREDAGITKKKVGKTETTIYTITETKYVGSTPWGKLKSGAGWINISQKYCERV